MATTKVVVTGIKKIDRKLQTLPLRIQKKVASQAIREGMKFMATVVKNEVPVDTGLTRTNVKVRAGLKRKGRRGEVSIDVRVDAVEGLKRTSGRTGQTVFYPAVVEYGREGEPADPFMLRAFQGSGGMARGITIRLLKEGVDREIKAS